MVISKLSLKSIVSTLILFSVLLLALVVRLQHINKNTMLTTGDEAFYLNIMNNIAGGKGLSLFSYQAEVLPLYPLLLGLSKLIVTQIDSYLLAQYVTTAMFLVSVIFLFLFAKNFTGNVLTAAIAAILYAFLPEWIFFSVHIYSESLFALFLFASLYLFTDLKVTYSLRIFLFILSVTAMCLTRYEGLFFVPLFILIFILSNVSSVLINKAKSLVVIIALVMPLLISLLVSKNLLNSQTSLGDDRTGLEERPRFSSLVPREYLLSIFRQLSDNNEFYKTELKSLFSEYYLFLAVALFFTVSIYWIKAPPKERWVLVLLSLWFGGNYLFKAYAFSGYSYRYALIFLTPLLIIISIFLSLIVKHFVKWMTNPLVKFGTLFLFISQLSFVIVPIWESHLSRLEECGVNAVCNNKNLLKEVGLYLKKNDRGALLAESTDFNTIYYYSQKDNFLVPYSQKDYSYFYNISPLAKSRGLSIYDFGEFFDVIRNNRIGLLYYDYLYLDQNSPFIKSASYLYPSIFNTERDFNSGYYDAKLIGINHDQLKNSYPESYPILYVDVTDKANTDKYISSQSSGSIDRYYQYTNSNPREWIAYKINLEKGPYTAIYTLHFTVGKLQRGAVFVNGIEKGTYFSDGRSAFKEFSINFNSENQGETEIKFQSTSGAVELVDLIFASLKPY